MAHCRLVDLLAGVPSCFRFTSPSSEGVNRKSASRSVTDAVDLLRHTPSKERSPASTWPTLMPNFAHTRAAASCGVHIPINQDNMLACVPGRCARTPS